MTATERDELECRLEHFGAWLEAEVQARIAAAVREEREACLTIAQDAAFTAYSPDGHMIGIQIAYRIRKRTGAAREQEGIPASPALDYDEQGRGGGR